MRKDTDVPDKPCTTVGDGPILMPRTEVMSALHALPARTHNREVVLTRKELLRLAPKAISQIRLVDMPIVQPKALLRKANRLCVHAKPGLGEDIGVGKSGYDHIEWLAQLVRCELPPRRGPCMLTNSQ